MRFSGEWVRSIKEGADTVRDRNLGSAWALIQSVIDLVN